MSTTAFTSRLGLGQGRVARVPGGTDFVFVLGDLEAGRKFDLESGDYAELTQGVDLTDATLLRVMATLRVSATPPSNLRWEVSLLVDGVKLSRVLGRSGRDKPLTDLAANVSKAVGVHQISVRLQLVEA